MNNKQILRVDLQDRIDAIGSNVTRYQPGGPVIPGSGSKRTVRGGHAQNGITPTDEHKSVRGGGSSSTGASPYTRSGGSPGSTPGGPQGQGLSLKGSLLDTDHESALSDLNLIDYQEDNDNNNDGEGEGGTVTIITESTSKQNLHDGKSDGGSGKSENSRQRAQQQPVTLKRRPSGMLGMISKAFSSNK